MPHDSGFRRRQKTKAFPRASVVTTEHKRMKPMYRASVDDEDIDPNYSPTTPAKIPKRGRTLDDHRHQHSNIRNTVQELRGLAVDDQHQRV
ncbi:uncharacterized protein RSE6_09822 [Rhynchosporium secalis]|uniref:Uncharacterized protein n=1 Tax=Rhynchosporium secalis TaxID=38038 RepID=A0A1E1MIW1_RHYSE|nr:uncharacterized protein RSE6_09822 [Rhynchosporium secalis]